MSKFKIVIPRVLPNQPTDEDDTSARVVIAQAWEESERGWGVRPDGYTLHLDVNDRKAWVDDHYAKHAGPAPDEYSRLCGSPFELAVPRSIVVDLKRAKKEGRHGIWIQRLDATMKRGQTVR